VLAHGEEEKRIYRRRKGSKLDALGELPARGALEEQWGKQANIENLDICRLSGFLI
jgi:hypothetical protein